MARTRSRAYLGVVVLGLLLPGPHAVVDPVHRPHEGCLPLAVARKARL